MNSKISITQSRQNQTKKSTKNCSTRYQSGSLIPTSIEQLSLNAPTPAPSENEPPAYPLQIGYIRHNKRVKPDKFCKLVHHSSGLTIKGQFSYSEAFEILETTRHWDWELDKHKIPRCADSLLSLLEKFSNEGGQANV